MFRMRPFKSCHSVIITVRYFKHFDPHYPKSSRESDSIFDNFVSTQMGNAKKTAHFNANLHHENDTKITDSLTKSGIKLMFINRLYTYGFKFVAYGFCVIWIYFLCRWIIEDMMGISGINRKIKKEKDKKDQSIKELDHQLEVTTNLEDKTLIQDHQNNAQENINDMYDDRDSKKDFSRVWGSFLFLFLVFIFITGLTY